MKIFYGILVLMILVVGCAQQQAATQPEPVPQPEAQPSEAQESQKVPVQPAQPAEEAAETGDAAVSSTEVRILDQGQFDPAELTINKGHTVTWVNTDSKEAVIIIFKDGKAYQNSQKIKPGERFEHEFKETGSYQCWRNIAFAANGAKITVK